MSRNLKSRLYNKLDTDIWHIHIGHTNIAYEVNLRADIVLTCRAYKETQEIHTSASQSITQTEILLTHSPEGHPANIRQTDISDKSIRFRNVPQIDTPHLGVRQKDIFHTDIKHLEILQNDFAALNIPHTNI